MRQTLAQRQDLARRRHEDEEAAVEGGHALGRVWVLEVEPGGGDHADGVAELGHDGDLVRGDGEHRERRAAQGERDQRGEREELHAWPGLWSHRTTGW